MTGGEVLERSERHLRRLLAASVWISSGLLALGLLLWLAGAAGPIDAALLQAGLLVLFGAPVLRVIVSLSEFSRRGDWLFVAVTLGVMAVLAATFVVAG